MMTESKILTELAADGGYDIQLAYDGAAILTAAMTEDLATALRNIPAGAKFVTLQASGPDFCAGRQSPTPPAGTKIGYSGMRARVAEPVLEFYAKLRDLPLPVIILLRGKAAGVGCAMAALGDLVLADDTARLSIPEMNKDIPPLLVMSALTDRISRASLSRLVLTREEINADEAKAIGLVTHALGKDDMAQTLADIRAALATNSPVVLATVKRFLNLGPELPFAQRREYAATANPAAASERFL